MTQQARKPYFGIQNLGWLDRIIRFMLTATLITSASTYLYLVAAPVWNHDSATANWPYWLLLIAMYPLITAVVGSDPVYRLFNVKTCGTSPRNPCGTFPYEMEAATGNDPQPRDNVEHSVANTRSHTPVHGAPR